MTRLRAYVGVVICAMGWTGCAGELAAEPDRLVDGAGGTLGRAGAGGHGGTGGHAGTAGQVNAGGSPAEGGHAGEAATGTGGSAPCGGGGEVTLVPGPWGPSCAEGLDCGGVSCCRSTWVPGGSFDMGRGESSCDAFLEGHADEQPPHAATVSGFYMDTFEVTVGRFRKFVEQYDGTKPAAGAGAHPLIPGSGWDPAWDGKLPPTQAQLANRQPCTDQTWTAEASTGERRPMNGVTWYEAFAFCAWDGGRLPTEAEWEFAAAGGNQNRLYPWGQEAPDASRARYWDAGGYWGDVNEGPEAVGSLPSGRGRWGQYDLAGNLSEWTLDAYSASWFGDDHSCHDCANVIGIKDRVIRGGSYFGGSEYLRATDRDKLARSTNSGISGFRCVRSK